MAGAKVGVGSDLPKDLAPGVGGSSSIHFTGPTPYSAINYLIFFLVRLGTTCWVRTHVRSHTCDFINESCPMSSWHSLTILLPLRAADCCIRCLDLLLESTPLLCLGCAV